MLNELMRRYAWLLLLPLLTQVGCGQQKRTASLLVYCAAGLRPPLAEIAEEFQKKNGLTVQCDYAGSEVLLSRLKASGRGDIYIPGDSYYMDQAAQAGLVLQRADAAYWTPVILVRKGNPKNIRKLSDLVQPGVRLGLGDAQACAIGRASADLFRKNAIDPAALEKAVVYRSMTVNELGVQAKLGKIDATIVWDATALLYAEHCEAVAIPSEHNQASGISVATLNCAHDATAAAAFLEFATSSEAQRIFVRHGYSVRPK